MRDQQFYVVTGYVREIVDMGLDVSKVAFYAAMGYALCELARFLGRSVVVLWI